MWFSLSGIMYMCVVRSGEGPACITPLRAGGRGGSRAVGGRGGCVSREQERGLWVQKGAETYGCSSTKLEQS